MSIVTGASRVLAALCLLPLAAHPVEAKGAKMVGKTGQ